MKRRGISLLEVLISIFVLSVGLLGLVAVLPVGIHHIREANKSDRVAACGQAALQDLKVRGTLTIGEWRATDRAALGSLDPTRLTGYDNAPRGYLLGESYAIDSMYVGAHAQPPSGSSVNDWNDFPYNAAAPGTPLASWARLQRVTWIDIQQPPGEPGLGPPLASSVFQWHDDTIIPAPKDSTQRPQQFSATDPSGNALKPEVTGDYTWLATVSPAAETYDFVKYLSTPTDPADNLPYTYPSNMRFCDVSVVVFWKRDLGLPSADFGDDPPPERQVVLQFIGTGLGGGGVRLFPLRRDAGGRFHPTGTPDAANYLDLKKDEWIMVSGRFPYEYSYEYPVGAPQKDTMLIGVHKWYRIVALGDTVIEDLDGSGTIDPPLEVYREATLAGPDWNSEWCVNLYDGTTRSEAIATLLSGVIGVYTTTVEMEW